MSKKLSSFDIYFFLLLLLFFPSSPEEKNFAKHRDDTYTIIGQVEHNQSIILAHELFKHKVQERICRLSSFLNEPRHWPVGPNRWPRLITDLVFHRTDELFIRRATHRAEENRSAIVHIPSLFLPTRHRSIFPIYPGLISRLSPSLADCSLLERESGSSFSSKRFFISRSNIEFCFSFFFFFF